MSDTAPPDRPRGEAILLAIGAAMLLAVGWFFLGQGQQALRASPAGFDGLQVWLASEGVGAQSFTGGWFLDETSVGLLVVPVYDTELDRSQTGLPAAK